MKMDADELARMEAWKVAFARWVAVVEANLRAVEARLEPLKGKD